MSNFELHFSGGVLRYNLVDNPLVETWSRMAEWYYGNNEYEREQLNQYFETMEYQEECDKLRKVGWELYEVSPISFDDTFMTTLDSRIYYRQQLNYLHSEYERIRGSLEIYDLPEAFNDQIHVCEKFHTPTRLIQSHIGERPRIRTRFIHKEWKSSAPWKMNYRPEDQKLFEAPKSGRLYMCYCEVGKPPFSAYRDRDEVLPTPWTQYGPAFYVTFHKWHGNEDFQAAKDWLDHTHGAGVYWMGEPCLGILEGTVDAAFDIVQENPTIREMRWT